MSFSWDPDQASFYPKHDWNKLFQKLEANTRRYVPVYTKRALVLPQGPIPCFKCGARTEFVEWQLQHPGYEIEYVFTHLMKEPHKPTTCVHTLPSNSDPLEERFIEKKKRKNRTYKYATLIPNFDLVKSG